MKHSTTGAMTSSSLGAFCTKPSKGVFRTQSYIQNGALARIVNGFHSFLPPFRGGRGGVLVFGIWSEGVMKKLLRNRAGGSS